ncbi:DUF1707 domain-containing protein [Nocardia panacis]|uniref:DUF1707 domain-containing protein n=1 Tax=Nocardia panacis TaxID=2340916 RepID=A0A3A4KJU8_9NOCA|nr:DUF1707 domain-containing protein [Nocardia panacis]RJO76934.1 DUF1707 domain-containing protein [Nocardia panacis]
MAESENNLPIPAPERAPAGIDDLAREQTAERLRFALEQGRFDVLELDRRLVVVYAARTAAELAAVTADLPALTDIAPVELRTKSGSRTKSGRWIVPDRIVVEATSGPVHLDFTDAFCPHAEVAVQVSIRSGSLRLTVPRGWQINTDRVDITSGKIRDELTAPALPHLPLLHVEGQVGSGYILAENPEPPRRSFWAWLRRRPAV